MSFSRTKGAPQVDMKIDRKIKAASQRIMSFISLYVDEER